MFMLFRNILPVERCDRGHLGEAEAEGLHGHLVQASHELHVVRSDRLPESGLQKDLTWRIKEILCFLLTFVLTHQVQE